MNICKYANAIDKLVWRCHKLKSPHDVKIHIRKDSIFESFKINITILYFLLFFFFTENISINNSYEKCKIFCQDIGEGSITPVSIGKFFACVRDKILKKMHIKWKKDLLAIEINPELGYPSVEIDESKIISSGNEIFRIFGLIDRQTKDAQIRGVLNNRTKERLLPIVKEYINTYVDDEEEQHSIRTRVFSDFFSSDQINDFDNLGFILKKVNHNVWFGAGLLLTNTIE